MTPAISQGERLRRTEHFIAYIRLSVVTFNSILYLTVAPAREQHTLALSIIAIAGLYALVTVFWDPESINETVMPAITMVLDNVLIAIWLYATGGYESPFFLLFYAEAAASVGRFGWRIGITSAIGSALLYLWVVLVDGNAPFYDVSARIAYIFFIIAFVAYVVEAARQVEREATVSEAAAEAYAELARLKSSFVATISHELRTPLTTIKGAASTLLKKDERLDTEQTRTLLEMLGRQTDRLSKLIQDLLDVATIDQGKVDFLLEVCDLSELIREEARTLGRRASSFISVDVDGEIDPVMCDQLLIKRAFHNLLDNAIKFSPAQPKVLVKLSQDTESVFVDVIDSGIGINPAEHERIFDRFYQVDSSLTRKVQGAGVGLNIARELVRLHRGDVEVHSDLGEGARFRVTLQKVPDLVESGSTELRSA
jgi:signal transduction histidine kinase